MTEFPKEKLSKELKVKEWKLIGRQSYELADQYAYKGTIK